MGNFAIIFLCLGLGLLFRVKRLLPENAHETLNRVILYVPLPALALVSLHGIPLGAGSLAPAAMAWILFFGAFVLFAVLGRLRGWEPEKTGALILTAGLGNTSFVGYPLLEALFGPRVLPTAILTDQAGSFLVLGTCGIAVASSYGAGKAMRVGAVAKRIFTFPPFLAVVAAFLLRPVPFPAWLDAMLVKLGTPLIPLALLSVGFQLRLDHGLLKREYRATAIGLLYKLALGPVLVVLGYRAFFWTAGLALEVTILQSMMAPMITAAIFASEYGLDAELANLMVGIGIPLSLVTVPLAARLFY